MKNLFPAAVLRFLFIGLLCLVEHSTFGQVLIQGRVSDIKDNTPVTDAEIILLRSNDTVYSDAFGIFQLTEGDIDLYQSDELTGSLVGRYGALAWQFNDEIALQIYNQLGALCYRKDHLNSFGRIYPTDLSDGHYFIRVSSTKGLRLYSLVKRGEHVLVGEYGTNFPDWETEGSAFSDSLQISRYGFYTRKLAINKDSKYTEIELLQYAYPDLDYLNKLLSREAFDMLYSSPSSGHMGEVQSVKLIYDSQVDRVYFMNSRKHQNHYKFAVDFIGYKGNMTSFVATQYNNHPDRHMYPVTLNYYSSQNLYTFEFFPGDGASCADVEMLYEKIRERSFIFENLFFYPSNDSWVNCTSIPVKTANDIYQGQNYLAMNLAEGYGYLKKVDLQNLSAAALGKHDILLVNGIPFDIPVLAGIITTEYQTPLSHINVLSHNRGTPNMCLRDGFENPKVDSLLNQLVYLKVEYDRFILRAATLDEARQFWDSREPNQEVILDIDASISGLVDLDEANLDLVNAIGGKAANFAEILNAFASEGFQAPVPEGYFAIPFSHYLEHIENNNINTLIDKLLNNPSIKNNPEECKEVLKAVRDAIKNAPINQELVSLVENRLGEYESFEKFRFRSSTNAEDLEGFNGAGLYDSYSGSLSNDPRSVADAIRKVWASLWNYNAFQEREYFRIDHRSCAMGILVHRSFPDEDANGVAITQNPYNTNPGFVINIQIGENSIVDPDPGVLHDQILLYMFSLNSNDPYSYEYLVNSNLLPPSKEHVLSKQELFLLGDYLMLLKRYFYNHVYSCECDFKDFGLDIEFKIDSEVTPRSLYIKQIRPY